MTRPPTRLATRKATRGTSPGAFNVRNLANWFGLWYADESPLDGSGDPITDGTVVTLADLSGNGRDMTSHSPGVRPDIDSDGGPGSTPVLAFIAESMRTAAFDALTDFTIVYLAKQRSTGHSAGERIGEGDGSPSCAWQRNGLSGGVGTNRITAASGNSGNFSITADEWVLVILECVSNAGRIQVNDIPFANMTGSPTTFQIDRWAIGNVNGTAGSSADQDIVMLGIIPGAITDAEASKIRTFAADRLGLTFSNETLYYDDWQRANATGNLGISPTNHLYDTTGSGAANVQILNNELTTDLGTFYTTPRLNFNPSEIEWDFSFREGGGGSGLDSTNAVGLSSSILNFSDMVHMVFGRGQIRIERLHPGTTEIAATVSWGETLTTGRVKVKFNFAAGTIVVTKPNGTTETIDWNANTTRDLSEYNTRNIFFEVIASADNENICGYTFTRAAK